MDHNISSNTLIEYIAGIKGIPVSAIKRMVNEILEEEQELITPFEAAYRVANLLDVKIKILDQSNQPKSKKQLPHKRVINKTPYVRDKKHAFLQNFVLSTKFFEKEQQKMEYRFDHYSLRGRMDVIKWEVQSGETTIILFEVKSKILDLQETIGRIHDYRTYLNMDVDPLFGKMPSKKLHTYLVLPEKEENQSLINEYNHMFKASDIDYIMLVDTKTNKYEVLTKDQL